MAHEHEFDHEHEPLGEADQAAIARIIWEQDTLELRTVGIDIGSSTSHLLFARVTLKRLAQDLSSRFVVIDRQILWRSPILLTPFLPDGTIDAHALSHFIQRAYRDAGLRRADIDSGAVILTGEAIKRTNARAIDEIFAAESGKFVCATAGHKLECMLAAHGSGATELARRRVECGLHVDVGGGTVANRAVHAGARVARNQARVAPVGDGQAVASCCSRSATWAAMGRSTVRKASRPWRSKRDTCDECVPSRAGRPQGGGRRSS